MQNNVHPKLKPLVSDLKKSNIRVFLSSTEFERECIRSGVADQWEWFYQSSVNERSFILTNFDNKAYDSENALICLLEWAIREDDNQNQLDGYLDFVLCGFIEWSDKELFFEDIFIDLELLNFDKGYLENIKSKYLKHKSKFKKKN